VYFPISLPARLGSGRITSPAGSGPKSIATGDFNGMGSPTWLFPTPAAEMWASCSATGTVLFSLR
jgi:hypothetical protein